MKFKFPALCLLFVCFHSTSFSQIIWQPTNGPEGGAFWNVYDDGQYAFAADAYHFFRTGDGLHWEQLPYGNIWPLATSPTKLAGGKGFGYNYEPVSDVKFVVSYDHGSTWIEGTMPPTTYNYFTSIAVCSHGVYVPDGYSGNIYRTQDDGLTWDSIPAPGMYCYDVWAFEDRLYAEYNSRYWRLALNGTDWELVSPVFGNGDYPFSMFASDSLLFFATENHLWCSSNSGSTWTQTTIQYHNNVDNFCKIGDRVYKSAGPTGIMYTDDFGHSWQALPIPNDFGTFDLATAGGQLLCGTYNKGVLRYDAPNQQLIPSSQGLNAAAVYYLTSGNGQLWAACGNGLFSYDPTQQAWAQAPLPLSGNDYDDVAVSPAGKIAAHTTYNEYFYLSMDGGVSWDTIVPSDSDPSHLPFINITKIYWVGENIILDSEWGYEARSTDLGQTWQFGNFPHDIVSFSGRYFGLNSSSRLVSSDDLGQSWNLETSANIPAIRTLFATDDRLFALVVDLPTKTSIYSSSDGIDWHYSSDGLPQIYLPEPFSTNYDGGVWHKGGRYYLYESSIGFFTSLDTCKTWLPVAQNTSGIVEAVDSTFYGSGFGSGVSKTGLPQNYGSLSAGHVFKDDNNNGIWDANEAALPNLQVSVKEPDAWYPYWFVYTEPDGHYAVGSSPGATDTLRVHVPSAYVQNINPPQYIISNAGNDRNFGVHFQPDITDVSITGYFAGRPRPGFQLGSYVLYRNEGTIPADGTVSVRLDPQYHFINADPPPTSIIGDSLLWNFNQTPLFSQQWIHINGMVDAAATIGSLITMNGHIEPGLSDFMPANNHFMRSDTVVGSYDPNEKRVEPAGGLTSAEIAAGKELVYTVQFQNTGNSQAERVRITDQLDTALNVSTLRLVASSHPVSSFRLLPGNLLEVTFEQIALPDSVSNEPASHGFVSFAIQRNKAFRQNYKIPNTAAIYFDFNNPVFTNTVMTPVASPTVSSVEPHSTDINLPDLLISPNPTAKDVVVDTRGRLSGPGDIVLINAQGKVCLSRQVSDLTSPVNMKITSLIDGVYIVRASGKQGVLFGKLVVGQ